MLMESFPCENVASCHLRLYIESRPWARDSTIGTCRWGRAGKSANGSGRTCAASSSMRSNTPRRPLPGPRAASELEVQRHLNDARVGCARDLAEVRVADVGVRIAEFHVVKYVEGIGAPFHQIGRA